MIQGPISRYGQLGNQLTAQHPFDADNLKYGIQLAMWGYLKKAGHCRPGGRGSQYRFRQPVRLRRRHDRLGRGLLLHSALLRLFRRHRHHPGRRADAGHSPGGKFPPSHFCRQPERVLAALAHDSGQLDEGLSVLSPLPVKPFGRLGKFTRKKIGGKLGKILPTSLATFIVYFVIGIWHGANFRYIAFGLWNGVLITGSLLLANSWIALRNALHISDSSRGLQVFRVLRTMALVFIGRYLTRAPRLLTALSMLWPTLTKPCLYQVADGTILRLGLQVSDLVIILAGTVSVLAVECYQERGGQVRKALERRGFGIQWLCILLPLVILLLWNFAGWVHRLGIHL